MKTTISHNTCLSSYSPHPLSRSPLSPPISLSIPSSPYLYVYLILPLSFSLSLSPLPFSLSPLSLIISLSSLSPLSPLSHSLHPSLSLSLSPNNLVNSVFSIPLSDIEVENVTLHGYASILVPICPNRCICYKQY